MRRKIVAVIGPAENACTQEVNNFAFELGESLVDSGFRVLTGGYDGIMEAVLKGAKQSAKYREGDTIGVIMSLNPDDANEFADIVIATGLNNARNQVITATADAVVALAGGAGTLSELAFSWKFGKTIVAVTGLGGWSEKLAGDAIDERRSEKIHKASTIAEIIDILNQFCEK